MSFFKKKEAPHEVEENRNKTQAESKLLDFERLDSIARLVNSKDDPMALKGGFGVIEYMLDKHKEKFTRGEENELFAKLVETAGMLEKKLNTLTIKADDESKYEIKKYAKGVLEKIDEIKRIKRN
ncbi:MAG: hypothetical protein ACP5HW_00920 [Candidatus Micrarchaeia archaeon]